MRKARESGVQLVVVGSIVIDTIETKSTRRENVLGGSVSYACLAASLFSRVGMVGVVGDDFPEEFITLYENSVIDMAGLQRKKGRTFRWAGAYEEDMDHRRTLSTELNVFESFSPELPSSYQDAPYFLLGNISPDLQLHVLSQARRPVFAVADTMDLWIKTARETLMQVISKVQLLTINDGEARQLTGEMNIKTAARRILGWGPQFVVIKKGGHGAMLFSASEVAIVPAYPVDEVKDPTGAGDSFAGAFMGVIARAREVSMNSIRRALLYGSVVASFGVQDFSVENIKALNLEAVEARRSELKGMVAVE